MLLFSFETPCYFVLFLKLYDMFKPSFYSELKIPEIMFFLSLGNSFHTLLSCYPNI